MATLRTRGKTRVLDWRNPQTGERFQRTLGSVSAVSESEAQLALKTLEYQLASGNPALLGRRPASSWTDFAFDYLTWHAKQFPASHWRTALIFEKHLTPFFGRRAIDNIGVRLVEEYVVLRTKCVAPGTANKELRTLKAALNKAVEWELIQHNPIDRREKGARDVNDAPVVFYAPPELAALYAKASLRNGAIWKLLANTGMRRAEALNLKWSDVSANAITIRSELGARTKSAKWRHVPVSPGARSALDVLGSLVGAAIPAHARVLPDITPAALTRQFQRDLRRAGLKGNLHQLRHTFASHLVMAGRPLYEVKELLGHASIKTTEIYAHLAPGHLQAAVKGMNL